MVAKRIVKTDPILLLEKNLQNWRFLLHKFSRNSVQGPVGTRNSELGTRNSELGTRNSVLGPTGPSKLGCFAM